MQRSERFFQDLITICVARYAHVDEHLQRVLGNRFYYQFARHPYKFPHTERLQSNTQFHFLLVTKRRFSNQGQRSILRKFHVIIRSAKSIQTYLPV